MKCSQFLLQRTEEPKASRSFLHETFRAIKQTQRCSSRMSLSRNETKERFCSKTRKMSEFLGRDQRNQLECFSETFCSTFVDNLQCDLDGAVHQLVSNSSAHTLEEGGRSGRTFTVGASQFPALAAGSVLFLSSPELVCTAAKDGRWAEETERFLHAYTLGDTGDISIHALEHLLQELQSHYEAAENQSCATASSIMQEAEAAAEPRRQEVGVVLGRVLAHALLGHCFSAHPLPEESFFLDFIMDHVGSENFTVEALENLMMVLNIGSGEDHEHAFMLDEHESHHHHHHEQKGRRKRSREKHEANATWEHRCFSAGELLQIHGLTGSAHSGMGRSEVVRLSPAFIQQILSGACAEATEPETQDGLTEAERYLYATVANVVITLVSMLGIVLLLCTSCTNVFQLCIQFCISMAVGSLTGDALLHLVPMFLGLHVHSDEDSSHGSSDHSHEDGIPDYTYKMLAALGGIYLFYLMESIFSLITQENHHQHAEETDPHHCDHGRVLEMFQKERRQKDRNQSTSETDLVKIEEQKSVSDLNEDKRETRMLPYMITIGDGIHNFADGLAVGAAFSLSWKSGLATSVAVLCHELPHEVGKRRSGGVLRFFPWRRIHAGVSSAGDFAILLYSGMSVPRALLLNLASAMISFVGLYIALSVATDFATTQWITAVAGGLFLYVGLADMLPTLVHARSRRPWLTFALQNLGLLTGWSVLLLLSLFEDKINF
uniref:Zinc transporter ZIP4 n=1 Tax=Oryzias sinensis TaxID=183150 RepID=A0A8C7Z2C5_9TELE